ncbi:Ger(x)C family spore germination protein [Virgibacillus sp. 179-BFC.A HS]|uniref:Ger(X)C family spore germination protein n=1 Tax=Tigheibacillus jepli TaxID=3035914 RepID=A0ABU5CJ32_9BACI|nr:Ger(x)C family spore germination protein [Virgibacillus sp. 179-BFC.A HS]MDY0405852.1 Ger(x)C family spore germination protein [Virgibacillus sp. 179-BFC.A HS]
MAKSKTCCILVCFVCLLLTAGCWDSKSIEDRGFIVGVALDIADAGENTPLGSNNLALTVQFIVPGGYATSQSSGGSGATPKAYKNITGTGDSVFSIAHQMDTKTSKQPYFEHIKVVLVSEEILKHDELFASIMDVFIREPEMRRGVDVLVTKGEAKKYLAFDAHEGQQIPAIYISKILENTLQSKRTIHPVRLGKMHEYLLGSSSFAVPVASMEKNNIDISGVAVFHGHNNKFIGMMNANETTGLNLVTGNMKYGGVEFKINNRLMNFEILDSKSKLKVDASNPQQVNIQVDIKLEGRIEEMYGDKRLLNENYIAAMEKKFQVKLNPLWRNLS